MEKTPVDIVDGNGVPTQRIKIADSGELHGNDKLNEGIAEFLES